MTTTEIRLNQNINPETKVYCIARQLRDHNRINIDLWYAILELKDKHINIIDKSKAESEVKE